MNTKQHSLGVATAVVTAWLACAAWPTTAQAYAAWADGCNNCHGDYNNDTYVSNSDATSWQTTLMSGHLGFMGNNTCSVCHQPPSGTPRSPVYIGISAGITGYSPISCLGCHGRAADATGACVTGSSSTINPANCGMGRGLRKHHANSGVTACSDCHTDSSGTVAGESAMPTYYFTPDTAHPSKPSDSCNAAAVPGNENKYGLAGLDNDGDLLYDSADPDCVDSDGDGIFNGSDNCTFVVNANQLDSNGDGYGNVCDADLNNSGGIVNFADLSLFRAAFGAVNPNADLNGNGGIVNFADLAIFRSLFGSPPGPSGLHP